MAQDDTRWPDERLDDLAAIAHLTAPLSATVAAQNVHLENLNKTMTSLDNRVGNIEADLRKGRHDIMVALIAFASTMCAALIGGAALLLTSQ